MKYIDSDYTPPPLKEGIDYYLDPRGFRVMSALFLKNRGYCCGNGCKHCPYTPKHQKGNTNIQE